MKRTLIEILGVIGLSVILPTISIVARMLLGDSTASMEKMMLVTGVVSIFIGFLYSKWFKKIHPLIGGISGSVFLGGIFALMQLVLGAFFFFALLSLFFIGYFSSKQSKLMKTTFLISGVLLSTLFSFLALPEIEKNLFTSLEVSPSPDFELRKTNKELVKLADFDNKIKIVTFWATWCAPCIKEMNLLESWYSDIKTTRNDIALIPINTDDGGNMKKTIKFQENIPYSFEFYIDTLDTNKKLFDLSGLPTMLVIDKNDNIVYRANGLVDTGDNFGKKLDKIISDLDNNR